MVDFSPQTLSPIQNNVPAEQGVGGVTPAAIPIARDLFNAAANEFKKRRENKTNDFLASFSKQQLKIADAVDQGLISARAAKSHLRANFVSAISSAPGLQKEILGLHQNLVNTSGLGKITQEGTPEEVRTNAMNDALARSGYILPDASEDEFEQARDNFITMQQAEKRLEIELKNINIQSQKIGLASKQREFVEQETKAAFTRAARDSIPAELNLFKTQLEGIINDPAKTVEDIDAAYNTLIEKYAEARTHMDTDVANAFMKPFDQWKDAAQKRKLGEYTAEQYKAAVEKTIQTQRFLVSRDPQFAAVIGLSSFFELPPDVLLGMDISISDYIKNNSVTDVEPANIFANNTTVRQYTESITTLLDKLDAKEIPAENEEELVNHVAQMFNGVTTYQSVLEKNPAAGKFIVDFLSSDTFRKFNESRGNKLNPNAIDEVSEVLNRHYADEVWGMARREFENNTVVLNVGKARMEPLYEGSMAFITTSLEETVNTKDVIQLKLTDSGITFVSSTEDRAAQDQMRRLNKELKPVLNKLFRAEAHLAGHKDYRKVAEERIGQIFSDFTFEGDEEQANLSDFSLGGAILDEALTTGGYVGNGDYQNAETPADVAAAFVGLTEKDDKEVIASFIKTTVGRNINPQTTAWCAAFVNGALGAKGIEGVDTNLARSFLNWGRGVDLPKKGDIVVLKRGTEAWQGHVGFYAGKDKNGNILVLGGNQGDKVSIQPYNPSRVLGYRRGKYEAS